MHPVWGKKGTKKYITLYIIYQKRNSFFEDYRMLFFIVYFLPFYSLLDFFLSSLPLFLHYSALSLSISSVMLAISLISLFSFYLLCPFSLFVLFIYVSFPSFPFVSFFFLFLVFLSSYSAAILFILCYSHFSVFSLFLWIVSHIPITRNTSIHKGRREKIVARKAAAVESVSDCSRFFSFPVFQIFTRLPLRTFDFSSPSLLFSEPSEEVRFFDDFRHRKRRTAPFPEKLSWKVRSSRADCERTETEAAVESPTQHRPMFR